MMALKSRTLEKIERKQVRQKKLAADKAKVRKRVIEQKKEHQKKMRDAKLRIVKGKAQEVQEVHEQRKRFRTERQQQQQELIEKARRKHEAVKGRQGGAARAQQERQVTFRSKCWQSITAKDYNRRVLTNVMLMSDTETTATQWL